MMMNRNETQQRLQAERASALNTRFAEFHRIHPRLTSARVSREKSRKRDVSFLESNLAARLDPDDYIKVLAIARRWFRAEEKETLPYVTRTKKEWFETLLFFRSENDANRERVRRLFVAR